MKKKSPFLHPFGVYTWRWLRIEVSIWRFIFDLFLVYTTNEGSKIRITKGKFGV